MPKRIARWVLVVLVAFAAAGCGDESTQTSQQAQAQTSAHQAAEVIRQFDWFMEKETPAGRTTLSRSQNGRVVNASFVHWNNREYTLNSTLQLDESGFVVEQSITGTSPFGAPIDESFNWQGGVAAWKTLGEGGSVASAEPAVYLPN